MNLPSGHGSLQRFGINQLLFSCVDLRKKPWQRKSHGLTSKNSRLGTNEVSIFARCWWVKHGAIQLLAIGSALTCLGEVGFINREIQLFIRGCHQKKL